MVIQANNRLLWKGDSMVTRDCPYCLNGKMTPERIGDNLFRLTCENCHSYYDNDSFGCGFIPCEICGGSGEIEPHMGLDNTLFEESDCAECGGLGFVDEPEPVD